MTDCPQEADLLVIILAVVGGIVAIGIILLILWKLLTAMVVRIYLAWPINQNQMVIIKFTPSPLKKAFF